MTTLTRKFGTLARTACVGAALSSCAAPATPDRRVGTWVMTANQRPMVVVQIRRQGGGWTGSVSMPEHLQISDDGMIFSRVGPKTTTRLITNGSAQDDRLRLVTRDAQDASETDELDLTLIDDNHAWLSMVGAPIKPWRLTRSMDNITISDGWNPEQSYVVDGDPVPSNAHMQAIFDADQKARQQVMESPARDESALAVDDAQRRVATRKLLSEGQLKTGQDFRLAAFVFQHGDKPDDYLLAHALSHAALAKGDIEARWIAAASLDRYLLSIGEAQIYGAGFDTRNGQVAHQQPFNSSLLTDDVRRAVGIPPVAEQLDQYKATVSRMLTK